MRWLPLFLAVASLEAAAQPTEYSASAMQWRIQTNAQYPKPQDAQGSTRFYEHSDSLMAAGTNLTETIQERGMAHLRQGDYDQALVFYERVCLLDPKTHGYVGYIYLNYLHDYPRALRHFNAYDALTPAFDDIEGNNPVSYLRGVAYQQLGDHAKAIEQMSRGIDAIDLKHGSKWVNYRYFINRAVSFLAMNQPERALGDLDKAVNNFTRSALTQYYRGRALLALNRRTEAKTAFQDAAFFLKALRAERGSYEEDDYNPVCEEEIDEALAELN